ncbi:hypothetical protein HaLaN_12838 [Haematococcus lacustris]|uniref:Uncharacterized protein n=1 Tax=Haematococcus lacustris TaxID=44745 RepID=A0A699Z2Y0_HAELA|nr:hypothetical protein HaLaN_12838 [Haematococcus lacustris]
MPCCPGRTITRQVAGQGLQCSAEHAAHWAQQVVGTHAPCPCAFGTLQTAPERHLSSPASGPSWSLVVPGDGGAVQAV